METYIYILTDGKNTKIGITSALKKRLSTYATHNVNIREFKKYLSTVEEAKRVESAIKQIFKDKLAGTSKEWFAESPEVVGRYVATLLEKPNFTSVLPSMHGVKLTEEAEKLKEEIARAVHDRNSKTETIRKNKQGLSELFANKFALGIPEHKLPENIVVKDGLCVDLEHCARRDGLGLVGKAVRKNFVHMPNDDHVWRYFHLIRLESGFYIAICTARVAMPYLEAIAQEEAKQEMVDSANELGWYCTFHNQWSWHDPDRTGLVLYQPKTSVQTTIRQWENSFRKWVIERKEVLKYEAFPDKDVLTKAIEDIERDSTFPLNILSYQDYCDKYFTCFFWDKDLPYSHWQKDVFTYLIDKWRATTKHTGIQAV